ncbi:hypothetical protein GEMRC1_007753 [Eukaryota sp. GEM-RC1]
MSYLLLAESSLTEGMAWLYISLPFFFLQFPESSVISVFLWWLLRSILWDITLSIVVGFVLGTVGAMVFNWSHKSNMFDKHSFIAYSVAQTLVVLGISVLINLSPLLAVFVSAYFFNAKLDYVGRALEVFYQDTIDSLLNFTFFLLFGLFFPWSEIVNIGGSRLFLLSLALLLLRRLPIFLLISNVVHFPFLSKVDKFYVGYFGPVGPTAIFYSLFIEKELDSQFPFSQSRHSLS